MAPSKSLFFFIMLALQLLCLGYLVHGFTAIIPHEFTVCLTRNYTLKSHFEYIGKELNITRYIETIDCYDINFLNTTTTHDLPEELVLDLIRSDPNVESISHNLVFGLENVFEGTPTSSESQV